MIKAGRWFSSCTLVSATNKTDCHNITEILLKLVLTTINLIKILLRDDFGINLVIGPRLAVLA